MQCSDALTCCVCLQIPSSERGKVLGWWTTCQQVGGIVGASLTSWMMAHSPDDWQVDASLCAVPFWLPVHLCYATCALCTHLTVRPMRMCCACAMYVLCTCLALMYI